METFFFIYSWTPIEIFALFVCVCVCQVPVQYTVPACWQRRSEEPVWFSLSHSAVLLVRLLARSLVLSYLPQDCLRSWTQRPTAGSLNCGYETDKWSGVNTENCSDRERHWRPGGNLLQMGVLGSLQELHRLTLPWWRFTRGQHLFQLAPVSGVRRAPGHAHFHKCVRAWRSKRTRSMCKPS